MRVDAQGHVGCGVAEEVRDLRHGAPFPDERAALLKIAGEITGTLDREELLARVQRLTAEMVPFNRVVTTRSSRRSRCC